MDDDDDRDAARMPRNESTKERLSPSQQAQEAACRPLVAAACASPESQERRLGSCDVEEAVVMLRSRG